MRPSPPSLHSAINSRARRVEFHAGDLPTTTCVIPAKVCVRVAPPPPNARWIRPQPNPVFPVRLPPSVATPVRHMQSRQAQSPQHSNKRPVGVH
ncbi:hypothetical protein BDY17DRAFT_291258 [Neohortaea acidophila]|uniref:Uncharacterized protein n=1 Tax=Neohortaea acidophila TaxID=245834 RepID=A0A6A6Q2R6_9PEZI|nr:uncharacterized protein BDY17DRAFT_291258 [Neohortaea acidophila]KAF2486321.1 hypothetical protein BDY17DRAFT_291258 [Neohortaea acidophila]